MLMGMGDEAGPELMAYVERALRVMEAAGSHSSEVPVEQLAREAGLPVATVERLLRVLARDGYLTERADGAFALSPTARRRTPRASGAGCPAASGPS